MHPRRLGSIRIVTACLSTAVVVLAAGTVSTRQALAGAKLKGAPGESAIVALDCSVRVVGRDETADALFGSGSLAGALWKLAESDSLLREGAEAMGCRPSLVDVSQPRRRIGPQKRDHLFYFSGLAPGTYRLGKITASSRPREDSSPLTDFDDVDYLPPPEAESLLTVTLAAGEVVYLGRLVVYEARFQDELPKEPPVRQVLVRKSSDAVEALRLLSRAAQGSPWEVHLVELSRALPTASAMRDTIAAW